MKKALLIAAAAVLLIVCFACAEAKPTDTITYAHYGDETETAPPAETKQAEATEPEASESAQTEASESEPIQTEATQTETAVQTDTETTAVIVPGEVAFSGFTPLAETAAPVDMNGLDLSAFDENSAEYAIYSDIGKLAVISRELDIYDECAKSWIVDKDELALVIPYAIYVFEQCEGGASALRSDLLRLISAFNVSEYAGGDDIKEKFLAESNEYITRTREELTGIMEYTSYIYNECFWQQDMLTEELRTVITLCSDLSGRKADGVSYGAETEALLSRILSAAEKLSSFCDEAYRTIRDPIYPYPYRIEREITDDYVTVYVYADDDTDVYTAENLGWSFDKSSVIYRYNDTLNRCETQIEKDKIYSYFRNWVPVVCLKNKQTGLVRKYNLVSMDLLEYEEIGDYNEKEIRSNLPDALKTAFANALGDDYSLFDLATFSEINILADESKNGINSIELITSLNTWTVTFDEPEPPIKDLDFSAFLRNSCIISIRRGAHDLDFNSLEYTLHGGKLYLYGYEEEIAAAGIDISPNYTYFLFFTTYICPHFGVNRFDGNGRLGGPAIGNLDFDLSLKKLDMKF